MSRAKMLTPNTPSTKNSSIISKIHNLIDVFSVGEHLWPANPKQLCRELQKNLRRLLAPVVYIVFDFSAQLGENIKNFQLLRSFSLKRCTELGALFKYFFNSQN